MPIHRTRRRGFAALAVAGAATLTLTGGALADDDDDDDRGLTAYGLTSATEIVELRLRDSGRLRPVAITGLNPADARVLGIDERPATGMLYAIGQGGGIYTVDPRTGVATFQSQSSIAPSGTEFGVDFNPAADRLRVVSDTGQNLRINVDTGAANVDGPLNPAPLGTGVVAAAYTNNDGSPQTGTVLYDLNATTDQLLLQSPPNAGTLAVVGAAGVDLPATTGFDIVSFLRNGVTESNVGFVVTGANAWGINLDTGKLSLLRTFRGASVIDIAVDVPAP